MPYKDPAAAKAYFAARYQAKKHAIYAVAAERRAEVGEAAHLRARRDYTLRSKYGITLEQAEALLAEQDSKCPVCQRFLVLGGNQGPDSAVVDHNHTTGQVRGLLCRTCNIAVGYIEKDTTRAIAAVDYLLARDAAYQTLDTDPPAG